MKFTKMQGCGNDYVYINCFTEQIKDEAALAKRISDRRYGVGGDGMVLIKPSLDADFTMHMYNLDGSRGEMCGNAIRCVGKYVFEHGMTAKKKLSIETPAGIKHLELKEYNRKIIEVTVDMGQPELRPMYVPVISEKAQVIDEPITIEGKKFVMTCISVGNPHAVVYVENTADFPVETYGPVFEKHPLFPKRVNTEFVHVLSRSEINMRVWERGSNETFACGTGATASAYACMLNKMTEDTVLVHMLGGDLEIHYDRQNNRLFMTGPAVTVFEGEFFVD